MQSRSFRQYVQVKLGLTVLHCHEEATRLAVLGNFDASVSWPVQSSLIDLPLISLPELAAAGDPLRASRLHPLDCILSRPEWTRLAFAISVQHKGQLTTNRATVYQY